MSESEIIRLREEVEKLRRWKLEASEVIMGLQDLGRALGLPLGERITGEVAAAKATELRRRAESAEQELEVLLRERTS